MNAGSFATLCTIRPSEQRNNQDGRNETYSDQDALLYPFDTFHGQDLISPRLLRDCIV